MAKHYGPPRNKLVIEPFAGAAGYSTYWQHPQVKLYDIELEIVELWDYLIYCSDKDIMKLPDWIESVDQVLELPFLAEQTLITSWLSYGKRQQLKETSSLKVYKAFVDYVRDGGPYPFKSSPRGLGLHAMWSPGIKERIIRQKKYIKNWTVDLLDYRSVPNVDAHWFVDPPYQSQMKAYNKDHKIDFLALGIWCNLRNGQVDVCEQEGADWLTFRPLYRNITHKRKRYTEMRWTKDRVELF